MNKTSHWLSTLLSYGVPAALIAVIIIFVLPYASPLQNTFDNTFQNIVVLTDIPTPIPNLPCTDPERGDIAFESIGGNGNLSLIEADGNGLCDLIHDPTYDGQIAWGPDGTQFAFVSYRNSSDPATLGSIYVTTVEAATLGNEPAYLTSGWGPAWSPNGRYIAFVDGVDDTNFDLFLIQPDGNNRIHLPGRSDSVAHLAWSPNNQYLAYRAWDNRLCWLDVSLALDLIDSQPVCQPYEPGMAYGPKWSPDGQWIAFIAQYRHSIYLVNITTNKVVTLINHFNQNFSIAWSPSGDQIAFVNSPSPSFDHDFDLYRMGVASRKSWIQME